MGAAVAALRASESALGPAWSGLGLGLGLG